MTKVLNEIINNYFSEEDKEILTNEINFNGFDLSFLTQREKEILNYREEGLTLHEIGDIYKVTQERIRQITYKSTYRIKARLTCLLNNLREQVIISEDDYSKELEGKLVEILKDKLPFLKKLIVYIEQLESVFKSVQKETSIENKLALADLNLSNRTKNALIRYFGRKSHEISLAEVIDLGNDVKKLRNFGSQSYDELVARLKSKGLELKE